MQSTIDRLSLDTVAMRTNDQIGPMERLLLEQFDHAVKNIVGWERGFNQYADRITQTLDGADLNAMWREFQASISLLNRQKSPFLNFLGFPVTRPVERVMYPVEEDFEEASEFGVPKGIRLGAPFTVGFGFKWYDLAIRYTWMFLAEADQAQVRALNSQALESSIRLQFVRILRAIFNNVNATSTINDGQTAINVYPLYNADGTVPPKYKGTSFAGSHTHYLTSGAVTIDPGDLQAIEDHLYHHGYRLTSGYTLMLFANRTETTVIRTFKLGVNSALYDFIPASGIGGGVFLPANSGIVGRPTPTAPAGFNAIGTYGPFVIIEEDYVPAGYVFASASGGELNLNNLVGIREHEQAGLRGLMLVKGADNDYPITDSYYRQGFGTGVRQRGGGVVMQVTASGSYTIPAAYA